ncbi:aspartate carbamoyltransferase catalytic subunit [Roseobacter sp. SK209-2-6]|nr:aspartate carbamoyltransferase catalytic subunit [Roseobacter sp. SK209-2-6]
MLKPCYSLFEGGQAGRGLRRFAGHGHRIHWFGLFDRRFRSAGLV